MKLYKVTCGCLTAGNISDTIDIYVIAEHEKKASELALEKMEELDWKYDDIVKNIELIADTDQYGCEYILVLGKGRRKDNE